MAPYYILNGEVIEMHPITTIMEWAAQLWRCIIAVIHSSWYLLIFALWPLPLYGWVHPGTGKVKSRFYVRIARQIIKIELHERCLTITTQRSCAQHEAQAWVENVPKSYSGRWPIVGETICSNGCQRLWTDPYFVAWNNGCTLYPSSYDS